jgi:hypothetical protein
VAINRELTGQQMRCGGGELGTYKEGVKGGAEGPEGQGCAGRGGAGTLEGVRRGGRVLRRGREKKEEGRGLCLAYQCAFRDRPRGGNASAAQRCNRSGATRWGRESGGGGGRGEGERGKTGGDCASRTSVYSVLACRVHARFFVLVQDGRQVE